MAEAIEDTQSRILEGIDSISTISGETLTTLKALVTETLKLPYLSPDDIASLERSTGVLQVVIPEYVPQLSRSALILQEVTTYVDILSHASRNLVNLADYTDLLNFATKPLRDLDRLIPHLQAVSETMSESRMWNYRETAREMTDAANLINDSARSLSTAGTALPAPVADAYEESADVRVVRVTARWSWRAFWWGVAACAAFVITVLALWVHAAGSAHG
jgi:hypothetical protein